MFSASFTCYGVVAMRKKSTGIRHPRELLDIIPGYGHDGELEATKEQFRDRLSEQTRVEPEDLDGPDARRRYNRHDLTSTQQNRGR
jgi:hypothetical protein